MSSLILPNKWTSQPQTPVGIDWSNPLTRGLCLGNTASLFNNAVNGAPPTRKTISVSNKAETVYSHANGEIVFSAPGIRAFVGRYLFDPTNARFGGMFSSTNRSGIYFEYSSSQLKAVVFNNGAWSTTNIGSTPATGALITLAVVSDSDTSHRVYRDGVLVATLTNTAQVSTFNVAGAMYCDASTFYTAAVNGVVGFAGFTSTPSNTEIKSLSDNPWQIFKAPARRIWVAGAGGNGTATITGVSGSGQVGTLFPSGNASVSLSGAFGTGSVGSVAASVSVATTITGVSGTGSVGTTTQTGTANVTAPSAAGTGSVGTVSASGSGSPDGNVTITGIAGTGQVGTLAAAGNAAVSIAGVSGAGSVGSVTPSVTVSTTITGVSGTGSVGTTTQTGTANTTVSSAVGTGLVGDVSAVGTSQNGNAVITGVSGTGQVGIVVATSGSLRTNQGGGWETYIAPIRKKTVKEVKKEFENLTYSEIVDEQKTAEIKIQHTQAKIQEIKSNVSAVKPFSLAPEIAKLKLLIAEEKIKIEALRELETKILIHAKIKKEKEKLLTDLAFIAEYLMDEDEYDYD